MEAAHTGMITGVLVSMEKSKIFTSAEMHGHGRSLVHCASCAVRLCVCEKHDGWLVAWGWCGCMLIRSSTVWLLPFTLS